MSREARREDLRSIMERRGLGALVLRRPANFAWFTGGADNRVDHADPLGVRKLFGAIGVVDLDAPPVLVAPEVAGLRIFAGYAGWDPDQLQGEIDRGDWYVAAGETGDLFRDDPTELWRDVMRRQPGRLAWHSTRPVDPDLN